MTEPLVKTTPAGPLETNCYTVTCPDTGQVLVIDPGFEPGLLRATFSRLDAVFFTHGHFDHVGAATEVVAGYQPVVLIHEDDQSMLASAALHGEGWGFTVSAPPAPDRLLSGDETLQVGKLSFKVIHTPGHSPGSSCLYGHGMLFSGDTLFSGSIGRTDLPGGSMPKMRESLSKLVELIDSTAKVYPGHGPASVFGREIRHNPFLE